MAPSLLEQLLEMGFEQEKAELAVKSSSNLDSAIEWLDKNADKSVEELQAAQQAKTTAASTSNEDDPNAEPPALKEGEVARSLVCNDCGKRFRSNAQAEFHASRTEHQNFSESTEEIAPLTEEEKKAKLEELRKNLAEKRKKQALVDKETEKQNEKIRMKSTKEVQDAKEELARKEQIKEAAKKRAEKAADIEAKKRIQAKIAADKEERRLKAERAKAEREGRAPPVDPSLAAAQAQQAAAPASRVVSHNEARLRLNVPSGPVVKTFPADTTLFEVAAALNEEAQDGFEVASFTQTFPKKSWMQEDFGMTLKEAGQVPSGNLIVKFM